MSKSKKNVIKTKVTPALMARIAILARDQDKSIPQLMLTALKQYLDLAENKNTANSSLEDLQSELKSLQAKTSKIDEFKHEINSLSVRLKNLELLLAQLQSQKPGVLPDTNFSAAVSFIGELDEDDTEDEPDEILTDFIT